LDGPTYLLFRNMSDMTQTLPSDASFLSISRKNNYSFVEHAIEAARTFFKPGEVLTADTIRMSLENVGVIPDSPLAWGQVFRVARKRGFLVPTGRWGHSLRADSKSRHVPEYVVAR